MKNNIKSIGACLLGILVGVFLSLGTDYVLQAKGFIPMDNLWVPVSMILFVLLYRTVYNIMGSYVVARFAPQNPMKHALIVGCIGATISAFGAIATANMNIGPAWYAWTLAILSIPSAWVGGKLYESSKK